jgi:hypothetical protein
MQNEAGQMAVILEYGMTEMEAKAYKLSLIYCEKVTQFFPKEITYQTKKGDPRKGYVFKHCHKLLREHGEEINDKELKLYIHAQLDILRHITQGQQHPHIGPEILSGPKAWNRWKLWKSKYEKASKFVTTPLAEQIVDINKEREVIELLKKTKQYFAVMFDRVDAEDINAALQTEDFFLWVRWGKVCHYYLILSPLVQEWINKSKINLTDKVSFDINRYLPGITTGVKEYFNKEFSHEFSSKNL